MGINNSRSFRKKKISLKDLPYDVILKILREFFICEIHSNKYSTFLNFRKEKKKLYGYFKYSNNYVEKKLIFYNTYYFGKYVDTFFEFYPKLREWKSIYFLIGKIEIREDYFYFNSFKKCTDLYGILIFDLNSTPLLEEVFITENKNKFKKELNISKVYFKNIEKVYYTNLLEFIKGCFLDPNSPFKVVYKGNSSKIVITPKRIKKRFRNYGFIC